MCALLDTASWTGQEVFNGVVTVGVIAYLIVKDWAHSRLGWWREKREIKRDFGLSNGKH